MSPSFSPGSSPPLSGSVVEPDDRSEERLRKLEERLRALEIENDLLAEQNEDTNLIGLISEELNASNDMGRIIESSLERLSLLKDIPFCASGSLDSDGAFRILLCYTSFTQQQPVTDRLMFPASFSQAAAAGPAFADAELCRLLGIEALFPPGVFAPLAALAVPVRVRKGTGRIFLFAAAEDPGRLRQMSDLLVRIADLIGGREENIFLLGELQRLNRELEQRVRERTRELQRANEEMSREIEQRRRSERELHESEDRFSRAIEEAPFPVMIHAEGGSVLSLNRAWRQITGYSRAEIATTADWTGRAYGVRKGEVQEQIERLYDLNKPLAEGEYAIICKDGSERLWDFSSSPLGRLADGKRAVISMAADITGHRALEEQLRQAQKMEAVGQFAGGVAHDFNNMLTAIIGYGELTVFGMAPDAPLRKNVEQMIEAANRAAHLTRDLLLFSRKQVTDLKTVDLRSVIRTVERLLARVIGEDIALAITLPQEALPVSADTHQIEQILINFATNARDAMPGGGTLAIGAGLVIFDAEFITAHGYGRPGRYAMVTVSDTGRGMDEATQRRVFEPFFTTKEVGKGTGLGLAVVYGIIKQHEGYINLYSEPGKGTTFRIYLPVVADGAGAVEPAGEAERPARGTETILVAEDNEVVRELVHAVLTESGYTVITAVDGEDAVAKFREHRDEIRMLLFDLIMPKKNGQEAYEEIRQLRPDIKVLFSSGYAPDMVRERVRLGSHLPVAYKPISPSALLKQVRGVLDARE